MNDKRQNEGDDSLFELFAHEHDEAAGETAPSRLKARLYTAIIRRQQEGGPLRALDETRSAGYSLCVFESLWDRVTTEGGQSFNCCSVCHARILAEHLEQAPIYWGHCPYVAFTKK
jgi:hypothetical protein